ncbi:MAG TPA: hypothetical protein VFF67_07105 [Thermoplasmata archaeon]|nr:hypothetical protein [Thermoplasmata archaeon]
MPLATPSDLDALAEREPRGAHDDYSRAALQRAVDEYLAQRRPRIAPFETEADGRGFPTILHALADVSVPLERLTLTLDHPPPAGAVWEYVPPFRSIDFTADGAALLVPLQGGAEPERYIARLNLREHYHPRSQVDDTSPARADSEPLRPGLLPWTGLASFVRTHGIVPLSVAVLLYGEDGRARLELDLVDGQLLPDVRAGRFPLSRRIRRSSRAAFGLDAYLGREEPGVLAARALEVLFETNGLPAIDLAHVLGGVRELTSSTLEGLKARGLVSYDRRTGVYRALLEAFRPPGERARGYEEPLAPLPNPALRSSVAELLAAADSRATCPLCGDPLPPGHRGILCDKCAREVAAQEPAAG